MAAQKKFPRPKKRKRDPKLPEPLAQVNLNAAGIDIGSRSHFVAVPSDRDPHSVREFGSFTTDLQCLADWLEDCEIDTVVMESTGVYWIPLMEILDERGFETLLVDPRQLKQVPGRKTDVCDAQWLQKLHTFGLLRGAFRPNDEICVLRSFLRQRTRAVEDCSRYTQHMQKAMTQMNLKLRNVVSDVTGVTGMRILRAIIDGEQDPDELAALRDHRCRKSKETIAKALQGNWREEHLFELTQAVEAYDFVRQQILACDSRIEKVLDGFESKTEEKAPAHKKTRVQGNAPRFDLRQHLYRVSSVDLTRVEGVDAYAGVQLIGEVGLDMTRWPSGKHFSSWLGVCPGNKITGGKRLSGRTKRCSNRAATILRLCANSLHRSKSALGAYFRRQKARHGTPVAITATAHKLARIIYAMLSKGEEYVDIGQEAFEEQYRQRAMVNLQRNARRLGFDLVEQEAAV